MNCKIVVVGSVNRDVVLEVGRFPHVGETLLADKLSYFAGGKGANQAVAAARLGAEVFLIGAVGDDEHGRYLAQYLMGEGVRCLWHICPFSPTGTAHIVLSGGENQIIVMGGANLQLRPEHVEKQECFIADCDVVLCQLETPLDTVQAALALAKKYRKPFVLNPAPAQRLPEDVLKNVDLMTPNQHEFALIFATDEWDVQAALERLNVANVLITCGKDGVIYRNHQGVCHLPAYAVDVVDSTGAGDAFNGALLAFWHLGLDKAVYYANAAAALSVTQKGAQSALPNLMQLKKWLGEC